MNNKLAKKVRVCFPLFLHRLHTLEQKKSHSLCKVILASSTSSANDRGPAVLSLSLSLFFTSTLLFRGENSSRSSERIASFSFIFSLVIYDRRYSDGKQQLLRLGHQRK